MATECRINDGGGRGVENWKKEAAINTEYLYYG